MHLVFHLPHYHTRCWSECESPCHCLYALYSVEFSLTFRGKYWWGFFLTAIAMGLELAANHFQMTYYLLLLVCIGAAYLWDAYQRKCSPFFQISRYLGRCSFSCFRLKLYQPSGHSRVCLDFYQGSSELTINPDGSYKESNSGLTYDYITEYSYGRLESFNLFIPLYGWRKF